MAAGTVSDQAGRAWSTNSNSCADVKTAFTAANAQLGYPSYSAVSCTADPVVVGTSVSFSPSGVWTVSAITATATSSGGGTGTDPGTGTGTTTTTSGTLTLKISLEPAPPSAERIQDLSLLFGLSIVFLVAVTGAKQLLQLFQVNHEKD